MNTPQRNQLLAQLSGRDHELLHVEHVDLPARQRLEESFRQIEFVYFFHTGMASILFKGRGDFQAEMGVVGHEGCSGCSVILGVDRTPQAITMQAAGSASRVSTANLWSAMDASRTLRTLLYHYVHTAIVQRDETALAASRGSLLERLARWLLMCQDRLLVAHLPLTHDLISVMLGVRRAGVTTALADLEGRELIKRGRRDVEITDRDGLISLAGSFYGAPGLEFRRLSDVDRLIVLQ